MYQHRFDGPFPKSPVAASWNHCFLCDPSFCVCADTAGGVAHGFSEKRIMILRSYGRQYSRDTGCTACTVFAGNHLTHHDMMRCGSHLSHNDILRFGPAGRPWHSVPPTSPRHGRKSPFSTPLICTEGRRNPATCGTNQSSRQRGLDPTLIGKDFQFKTFCQ